MGTGFHFQEDMPLFTVEGGDIPVILALMAAAIALEVFLALRQDMRLGLVLPGLWLLRSMVQLIVWMIQVSAYSSLSVMGGTLCIALLVENIPTALLLAVYGLCRLCRRGRNERQLKKTRIEDL